MLILAVMSVQGDTQERVGHTFDLQSWAKKPLPPDVRSIVISFFDKQLKGK